MSSIFLGVSPRRGAETGMKGVAGMDRGGPAAIGDGGAAAMARGGPAAIGEALAAGETWGTGLDFRFMIVPHWGHMNRSGTGCGMASMNWQLGHGRVDLAMAPPPSRKGIADVDNLFRGSLLARSSFAGAINVPYQNFKFTIQSVISGPGRWSSG